MRDVYDFAKFFLKKGADSKPNTYDGNMKLQKLLVLANLASIAEYGETLFDDQILAFQNGCVVEKVRLRYKNDYFAFKRDSDVYQPDFTQREYTILNLIMDIFGAATAKELSDINHTFRFWEIAYANGTTSGGYHDKEKSAVNMMSQKEDIDRMREIITAYRETAKEASSCEIINGVTFFYDDIELTDDILDQLEMFSRTADEDSYSVYLDGGRTQCFIY